jgi:hypothetical protein
MIICMYNNDKLVMRMEASIRSATVDVIHAAPGYHINVIKKYRLPRIGWRKVLGFKGFLRAYEVSVDTGATPAGIFQIDCEAGDVSTMVAFGHNSWRFETDDDDEDVPLTLTQTVKSMEWRRSFEKIVERHRMRKQAPVPEGTTVMTSVC